AGEVARAEEGERHHRLAPARLDGEEGGEGGGAQGERGGDGRVSEAAVGRLEEAVGEAGEGGGGEERPRPVEAAGVGVAALRHAGEGDGDDRGGDGEVQEEDPAPAAMVDEPAADDRPERRGERRRPRPGADRPPA